MEHLPPQLIRALTTLGLSNYEAKVYAALVLLNQAEAKELVEFLDISKPSIYEALEKLEEMGLAVKRNSKPAMFSPVSSEISVKILLHNHISASEQALEELKKLEKEKVKTGGSDALWTIYGDANVGYKIQEMIGRARKSIDCMMGERFLPYLPHQKIPAGVFLKLIVASDDPALEEQLKKRFGPINTEIHVVSLQKIQTPPPNAPPGFIEMHSCMKFENSLDLIIDDEELLNIPPIDTTHVSGLNTTNKGAIMHAKLLARNLWEPFIHDGEMPLPPFLKRAKTVKKPKK
jgi:sugar-specific transcriptional regulator TrmB